MHEQSALIFVTDYPMMTFDTTPWRNLTKQQKQTRDEKWPLFEAWLYERGKDDETDVYEEIAAYKQFYDKGDVHPIYKHWEYLTLLHASHEMAAMHEVVKFMQKGMYANGLCTVYRQILFFKDFVENGFVTREHLYNFIVAVHGEDYLEHIKIWAADPFDKAGQVVSDAVIALGEWRPCYDPDLIPYQLVFKHLLTALPYYKASISPSGVEYNITPLCRVYSWLPNRHRNPELALPYYQQVIDLLLSDNVDPEVKRWSTNFLKQLEAEAES
ncbi:hypothetical protein AAEU29_09055 [Pseudoalteromonas sp. SSM20]|uniref:hypothetical protein n=1 Tax=Pseudoalteromonas sp. SSM20 TaxID=3139394 RepID=UPI003BA8B683